MANYQLDKTGAYVQNLISQFASSKGTDTIPIYVNGGSNATPGTLTQITAANMFSAFSVANGTTAGPVLSITIAGQNRTVTIPSASTTISGVITTGGQHIKGNKFLQGGNYIIEFLESGDSQRGFLIEDVNSKVKGNFCYNPSSAKTILYVGSNSSPYAEGTIYLYADSGKWAAIKLTASRSYDKSFYLPNYNGDSYLAHTASTSAVGTSTKSVYVAANGRITEGSSYAGGTAVTLNGTSKAASTASFYAPTAAGTSGYWLKSAGSGAPTWDSWSVSNTWTGGTSEGPTLTTTVNGTTGTAVAIPSASSTASGVVTTDAQIFNGIKNFSKGIKITTTWSALPSGNLLNIKNNNTDGTSYISLEADANGQSVLLDIHAGYILFRNYESGVGYSWGATLGTDPRGSGHSGFLYIAENLGTIGGSWVDGHRNYDRLGSAIALFTNYNASGTTFIPWMRQRDHISQTNWCIGMLSGQAFYIVRGDNTNAGNTFASTLKHETNGVTYSTAGFATGSDRRLKNIIRETSPQEAYTILKNITIYDYTLKQNIVEEGQTPFENKIQNGIMAQDLIQILKDNNIGDRSYLTRMELPEFNMIEDYELEEDELQYINPESMNKSFWCIKYSEMIPLIIKGWQMQQEQIEQLQQENDELRALINK